MAEWFSGNGDNPLPIIFCLEEREDFKKNKLELHKHSLGNECHNPHSGGKVPITEILLSNTHTTLARSDEISYKLENLSESRYIREVLDTVATNIAYSPNNPLGIYIVNPISEYTNEREGEVWGGI